MTCTGTKLPLLRSSNTSVSKFQHIPQPRGTYICAKARAAPAQSPTQPASQPPDGGRAYLEHSDVGRAVRAHLAAIYFHVLQPLDVWLGITVHLAVELHITAQNGCLVSRQPSLQDGPVWGALCKKQSGQGQWAKGPRDALP